jgi:hypothetical protein
MSACIEVNNGLTERDTVAEEDQTGYDEVRQGLLLNENFFYGFFYNRTHVWFKVHRGDTRQVLVTIKFKGSEKPMEYLLQTTSGLKPEDLTLDGPVAWVAQEEPGVSSK